jgi:acetyltransferase-like isoleucine patch superfamily enzyme
MSQKTPRPNYVRTEKGITFFEVAAKVVLPPSSSVNSGTVFDARSADIIIGENVAIGHNCFFITSYGSHYLGQEAVKRKKPIVVKENAWIGYGAMIRGGVTIGRGAVVGMGSVVLKDVPDYHVVAGNPARDLGLRPDHPLFLEAESRSQGELDALHDRG